MKKLEETLSLVTELHSHSIINKDKYYTDKLLQILINISTLQEELSNNTVDDNQEEIDKVKRKVPKWLKKTHQSNFKILETYMKLSNNNEVTVNINELKKQSKIEPKIFVGHYNGMKTISKKNHSKVFEESHKEVSLWKPIARFIEELFEGEEMNRENKFRKFALPTVKHETTIDGYIRSLNEDFPNKLHIESLFQNSNIKYCKKLYDECSRDGDLHDWNYSIGNGRPGSSIKKYIEFLTFSENLSS